MSPEDVVRALTEKPLKKPSRCMSCTYLKASDANRAMVAFETLKVSCETTQEWKTLHQLIVEKYDYPTCCYSMRRHMRNCLGLT